MALCVPLDAPGLSGVTADDSGSPPRCEELGASTNGPTLLLQSNIDTLKANWRYRKHRENLPSNCCHIGSNILRQSIQNLEDMLCCIQTALKKDSLTISMSHRSQLVPITRLAEKSGRDQSGLRSLAFARPPLRRVLKKGCEAGWFKPWKKKKRKRRKVWRSEEKIVGLNLYMMCSLASQIPKILFAQILAS